MKAFRIDEILLEDVERYSTLNSTTVSNVFRMAIFAYMTKIARDKRTQSLYE